MTRKYSIVGSAAAGSNKTLLALISATTIRPEIVDLILSCGANPADLSTRYRLQRFTASGTGATVTPNPLDPDDPAATATAKKAHSAEPTYTADKELLMFALNQRVTFRQCCYPGFALKLPAVAANGIGLQTIESGGTASHDATIYFEE